jgi:hypothetical protein
MGLCNFFRSHLRNFAQIGSLLNKLSSIEIRLKGGDLPEECLKAFNQLKMALCLEPEVAYPRKNLPYSLIVVATTGNEKMREVWVPHCAKQIKKGITKYLHMQADNY